MAPTQLNDPDSCCLVPRGTWDRLTIYSPLDLVTYLGSSYVALTENIGTEPTFFSVAWMVLSEKGDDGQTLNPRGPWQKSTIYNRLDVVSYLGSSWIARKESIGRAPKEDQFWMLLAERGSGSGSLTVQSGGGTSDRNVFIQPSAPATSEPTYLWIQTGLGVSGTDMTFWVEDDIP